MEQGKHTYESQKVQKKATTGCEANRAKVAHQRRTGEVGTTPRAMKQGRQANPIPKVKRVKRGSEAVVNKSKVAKRRKTGEVGTTSCTMVRGDVGETEMWLRTPSLPLGLPLGHHMAIAWPSLGHRLSR